MHPAVGFRLPDVASMSPRGSSCMVRRDRECGQILSESTGGGGLTLTATAERVASAPPGEGLPAAARSRDDPQSLFSCIAHQPAELLTATRGYSERG
eukprot:scaffold2088_cov399-Prasinococcus_capsulatus_cf.AAC.40